MLADPRATDALVDDFAAQWLNLRRVDEVVVHPDVYPNFDDSLLEAFKQETELFVAQHAARGSQRARTCCAPTTRSSTSGWRGTTGFPGSTAAASAASRCRTPISAAGCSRNGALLATTSYPGSDVAGAARQVAAEQHLRPAGAAAAARRRHEPAGDQAGRGAADDPRAAGAARQDPACASCHSVIDPLGFALENFDAIGGWRTVDESGKPVDASGTTVSGAKVEGLAGLRALLLEQPEQFPAHGHREAAGLRARPAARVLRSAGRAADRPRRGGRTTTAGRRSFWES